MEERELVRATIAINNPVRDDGNLHQRSNGKNCEKWSDSEYFKESTGCANNHGNEIKEK